MRPRVALAVLILIWLAASVGPATAQGCDDCREIKQELRGAAIASTPQPAPPPSPASVGWPIGDQPARAGGASGDVLAGGLRALPRGTG